MREHFGRYPVAEVYLSQPGMDPLLGARVLAEFGDDPHCYRDGKARRNRYRENGDRTLAGATDVFQPARPVPVIFRHHLAKLV